MNKKTFINALLVFALVVASVICILSIGVLADGEYSIFGYALTETSLTVLITASMLIAMLATSGLIYYSKKNNSGNQK
ncbi:MAG: hypothetical protein PHO06_00565 [Clostridia bacterium]|jgi:uncharacterized membrane protein|nr:hypothetical protein [Clostridia bacterium]